MKNLFNKSIKVMALGMALTMSSCLEDKGYLDVFNGENDGPVVSFGGADYGQIVRAVEVKEEAQKVGLTVNIARATSDVSVTLEVDPAFLDEYNEAHADDDDYTPFDLLPDSTFDLPSMTFTIPKGQLDYEFEFDVFSTKIDLTENYALPLVIKSVTDGTVIASNLSTSIMNVTVKNAYDGKYDLNITMNGWAAYDIPENKPQDYSDPLGLVTAGPNSVGIWNYWANTDLLPGFSSTGQTQFGAASPVFVFDENHKLVGISNAYPNDGRNRRFAINPTAPATDNVWNDFDDLSKRNITLNFLFQQDGRPDNNVIYKLTYQGAR
jgi:hypothetical protein